MGATKTTQTKASVDAFLAEIPDRVRREDCVRVLQMMKAATKSEARMWGTSMVGCGSYHYKYESGREGDSFLTGFAPRKKDITLYLGSVDSHAMLLKKLGKHKTGKGCLYIRALADVDIAVLKSLIEASVKARQGRGGQKQGA